MTDTVAARKLIGLSPNFGLALSDYPCCAHLPHRVAEGGLNMDRLNLESAVKAPEPGPSASASGFDLSDRGLGPPNRDIAGRAGHRSERGGRVGRAQPAVQLQDQALAHLLV